MLKKFADAHKLQFDKFYTCSFGENPTNADIVSLTSYKTKCVDVKVAAVVEKFNKFWAISTKTYRTLHLWFQVYHYFHHTRIETQIQLELLCSIMQYFPFLLLSLIQATRVRN